MPENYLVQLQLGLNKEYMRKSGRRRFDIFSGYRETFLINDPKLIFYKNYIFVQICRTFAHIIVMSLELNWSYSNGLLAIILSKSIFSVSSKLTEVSYCHI